MRGRFSAAALPAALSLLLALGCVPVRAQDSESAPAQDSGSAQAPAGQPGVAGMDEAVNERLAEEAGLPSRNPYIDLESMGELWNLVLLLAGGICGFLLGRHWDQIWGRPDKRRDR